MNPWRYVLRAIGDDDLSQVLVDAKAIVCTDRHRMHAAPHKLGAGPWIAQPILVTRTLTEDFVRRTDTAEVKRMVCHIDLDGAKRHATDFPPWRKIVTKEPRIAVDASTLRDMLNLAKPHFSKWRHCAYDQAMSTWHEKTGDQRRERSDRPQLGDFCPTILFGPAYVFGGWANQPNVLELGRSPDGWPAEVRGLYNAEYLDDATRGCTVSGLEILGCETNDGSLICPLRIVSSQGCLAIVAAVKV